LQARAWVVESRRAAQRTQRRRDGGAHERSPPYPELLELFLDDVRVEHEVLVVGGLVQGAEHVVHGLPVVGVDERVLVDRSGHVRPALDRHRALVPVAPRERHLAPADDCRARVDADSRRLDHNVLGRGVGQAVHGERAQRLLVEHVERLQHAVALLGRRQGQQNRAGRLDGKHVAVGALVVGGDAFGDGAHRQPDVVGVRQAESPVDGEVDARGVVDLEDAVPIARPRHAREHQRDGVAAAPVRGVAKALEQDGLVHVHVHKGAREIDVLPLVLVGGQDEVPEGVDGGGVARAMGVGVGVKVERGGASERLATSSTGGPAQGWGASGNNDKDNNNDRDNNNDHDTVTRHDD
jgi:hypothetical protein